MPSKKLTKKSEGSVQLSLDVSPETKQLLEVLRKKFELKTKAQTFEKILRQIAVQEKISTLSEHNTILEILLGIECKLDQLIESLEDKDIL